MLHFKNTIGRVAALSCAAALVSGTAMADVVYLSSDINEYTLEPEDPCNDGNPNNDIYHNCPGAYVAPVTEYQPEPPAQTYQVQEYVAPEETYVDRCNDGITTNNEGCNPCDDDDPNNDDDPLCGGYVIQAEPAPQPAPEPYVAPETEVIEYVAPRPDPVPPTPEVVYQPPKPAPTPAPPPPAPAGPAPTVVKAPVGPVTAGGGGGLGGAGAIAAGALGLAALGGVIWLIADDDDDDATATRTQ